LLILTAYIHFLSAPSSRLSSVRVLCNLALRGFTLVSRFLLLFALAHWLEPSDVGMIGLLSAIIGYGIYLIGLEFYTFSARELIHSAPERRAWLLWHQVVLHIFTFLAGALVLYLASIAQWIPHGYLGWLCVLLLLEQVAQEVYRILVALSRQLTASFVLFVRTGAWCLVVIVAIAMDPSLRHVSFVLTCWTVGAAIACLLGVAGLGRAIRFSRPASWDLQWIRKGLRIALPLFVASLAVRGMATFDRFMVENAVGLDVLGAYVLFASVAVAVLAFLDAGVVDFAYPRLVALVSSKDRQGFLDEMAKVRTRVLSMTAMLVLGALITSHILVRLLDRPVYTEHLMLVHSLLAIATLNALSVIPHLGLYALRQDRPILASQLMGFAVFIGVALTGMQSLGVHAVLCGLAASWILILIWKARAYRRLIHQFNW
jgi:O-antigen/teichoic acid export membrane protein